MNFKQFLNEAPRVDEVTPEKDSAKAKRFRSPGDVGPVDRLTQLDKDKTKQVVRRRAGAKNTLAKVDRDYSKPDQYVDKVGREVGDAPVVPDDSERRFRASADKKRIKGGFKPKMSRVLAADDKMRDEVKRAEAPTVKEPIPIKGTRETVSDTAYLRHGYQRSGVGLNKKLGDEDIEYLIQATADRSPVKKGKNPKFRNPDAPQPEDTGGIEQTKQRRPTGRDIEALDPEAEKIAAQDKAYLNPKVMKRAKALRDALGKQDAKGVQKLAFQHKVSDEMLDNYINSYGMTSDNKNAKETLLDRIGGAGGTAFQKSPDGSVRAYGGDLGPDVRKDAIIAPGVYNYNKLTASQKKQAQRNRAREIVRTYLKQGGRDAYADHEGIRAITDMDLEHITSLRGEGAGLDQPSNWVFASGQSNRLRGERNLTGEGSPVERLAQGKGVGPGSSIMRDAKNTYMDYMKKLKKDRNQEAITDLEDAGIARSIFQVGNYKNLGDSERQDLRDALMMTGASKEAAEKMFPKASVSDFKVSGDDKSAASYVADPQGYADATTRDARDRLMHNTILDTMKGMPEFEGMDREDLKNSDEYKEFKKRMSGMTTGEMTRAKSSPTRQDDF